MACDDCDRCRALGYRFCIKCGQDFSASAPVPPYRVEKESSGMDLLHKSVLPSMALIMVLAVVSAIILIFNAGVTVDFLSTYKSNLSLYFIDVFVLTTITDTALQVFFVLVATAAIASVIVLLYDSRDAFRIGSYDYLENTRKTSAYWVGLLLGSVLVVELIVNFLMTLVGYAPETPEWILEMTLPEAIFSFTKAAVWEEIAFRVMFMGVPMMVIAFCFRQNGLRHLFGGTGVTKVGIVLTVISALLFAYAHVDGWGLWTMFPTVFGGLMFGYLYMRFGLHACIVAHLVNDYATVWLQVFGGFGSLMFIGLLFLGVVCIPILVKKTLDGIRGCKDLPLTGFDKVQDSMDSNTD